MRAAAVVLAVALLAAPGPARARSPQDVANDVARTIMSPYCPGVTLHDCPSAQARELRERIVGMARRGMGTTEIVARLERDFGYRLRATPPSGGLGALGWVLPFAAAGLGLGLAGWLAARWRRAGQGAELPPPSAEERARLRAELETLRRRG